MSLTSYAGKHQWPGAAGPSVFVFTGKAARSLPSIPDSLSWTWCATPGVDSRGFVIPFIVRGVTKARSAARSSMAVVT